MVEKINPAPFKFGIFVKKRFSTKSCDQQTVVFVPKVAVADAGQGAIWVTLNSHISPGCYPDKKICRIQVKLLSIQNINLSSCVKFWQLYFLKIFYRLSQFRLVGGRFYVASATPDVVTAPVRVKPKTFTTPTITEGLHISQTK
ncbi:hypothetical protein CEXT_353131 [Caerostris extrusa]|uniref:Uncharacterized protein n=1 Tax=Caerostris extrusa TaxID=172846 RepID=A0AAV4VXQ5_CAEEX|nr:hypothetical protein CEXT_353131 [Caerostris extrusa]